MTDEQLSELFKVARIETLQLVKRDYLTAMLDGKMDEKVYIDLEKKINVEICRKIEEG